MTLESEIDQLWSKGTSRPGACTYWTEADVEKHFKVVSETSRLVALVKANKELALLSEHEEIASLARDMLAKDLSSEEKRKLHEMEQLVEGRTNAIYGLPNKLETALDTVKKIEIMTEIVKARPVEAITSPSLYVRKFAKKVIPSEQYKSLKKEFKVVKGKNK